MISCRAGILLVIGLSLFAEEQSVALSGIAHVALRVSDLAKSRRFYRLLGFEQAFEFTDDGKPSVSYVKVNDRQFIELYRQKDMSQPIGLMHVCFESDDLNSLQEAYAARGLDASIPRKGRAGNLLFALHDPVGQLIEYTQYLPGSLHSEDNGKHLGNDAVSRHLWRVEFCAANVPEVEAFYISKLGFEEPSGAPPTAFRLPGNSNQQVAFTSNGEPNAAIVLEVSDVTAAAATLRRRGIKVQKEGQSVSITDPDGLTIRFARPTIPTEP